MQNMTQYVKYAKYAENIILKYAENMQKICCIYAEKMLKICSVICKICRIYTKHVLEYVKIDKICNKIYM